MWYTIDSHDQEIIEGQERNVDDLYREYVSILRLEKRERIFVRLTFDFREELLVRTIQRR